MPLLESLGKERRTEYFHQIKDRLQAGRVTASDIVDLRMEGFADNDPRKGILNKMKKELVPVMRELEAATKNVPETEEMDRMIGVRKNIQNLNLPIEPPVWNSAREEQAYTLRRAKDRLKKIQQRVAIKLSEWLNKSAQQIDPMNALKEVSTFVTEAQRTSEELQTSAKKVAEERSRPVAQQSSDLEGFVDEAPQPKETKKGRVDLGDLLKRAEKVKKAA